MLRLSPQALREFDVERGVSVLRIFGRIGQRRCPSSSTHYLLLLKRKKDFCEEKLESKRSALIKTKNESTQGFPRREYCPLKNIS
jgi:hypothetical protein